MESFLSKDINYLVTNKKEAKFAPTLGQISPVPSPESASNGGNGSPHPSNRKDRHDGSSFKIVDTVSFLVIMLQIRCDAWDRLLKIFLLFCFLKVAAVPWVKKGFSCKHSFKFIQANLLNLTNSN